MSAESARQLNRALWRIYRRPTRPLPWAYGGNLPWDEPAFSRRLLREHLDQTHGAASRTEAERAQQIAWLRETLDLQPAQQLLDVTCGPGLYALALAQQGCHVTGIDFSPASITYARQLVQSHQLADRCRFVQADVRTAVYETAHYDAAILLYGQLAVMQRAEAQTVLDNIGRALKPNGRLCLELLDQAQVDKQPSRWWYTDETGVWGDAPYLHLGERWWYDAEQLSLERYLIVHLETGQLDEITLCDQTYSTAEMTAMLHRAGFGSVTVYPHWADLPLYDAKEWLVYIAHKTDAAV